MPQKYASMLHFKMSKNIVFVYGSEFYQIDATTENAQLTVYTNET